MTAADRDTIFAAATGSGRAAIAVLRLSGPDSGATLDLLCGSRPPARQARLRRLRDMEGGTLDHAIVLWLPGPGSYTGEDSAELHLHGGPAILAAVADALIARGARPAGPGEFTRRAFLSGRMDLLQAEAIGDLVEAETEGQRRQALRQMEGALGAIYRDWATRLRLLLAQQEALIDFPDEDIPPETEAVMLAELGSLRDAIQAHLDDRGRGERLRSGLVFVVAGAPNVGKSSLVNALAGREVAIVTEQPGTTRDALETRIVLGDVPVTLTDTAGLRMPADAIEAEGVRRAEQRARTADLVIAVGVAGGPPAVLPEQVDGILPVLLVANKADLGGKVPQGLTAVSARTGAGIGELRQMLAARARSLTDAAGPPPLTRARHRAALLRAGDHLAAAAAAAWPELRGEDLRLALRALGGITGQVGVEDILDTIFGQFCIGK